MNSINKNNVGNQNSGSVGNASNPLATENDLQSANNGLLNDKAETYLREAGNIEDMPDDNDYEDMDQQLKKEK